MAYLTRTDIPAAIEVSVGERNYLVDLSVEGVWQEVRSRSGRLHLRRVASRRIETSALIRASDKAHA